MTHLGVLRNKLKSFHIEVVNITRDVLELKRTDKRTDEIAGRLEGDALKLLETVMELKKASGRAVALGAEIEMESLAEKASTFPMQIDLLSNLGRLDYVQLAELLGKVHPDLLPETVKELSSQPDGWERLELLAKIIRDILATRQR